MTTNRMANFGWKMFGLAVLAFGVLGSATARAQPQPYAHWPLDDGDGDEAKNLADENAPGFIFDWDSLDSLGGTEDDPTVWVEDPNRPGPNGPGIVLGTNGLTQWVEAGFLPIMDLENDHTWAFWGRLPPGQPSPNNDIVLGSRWGENGSDTTPREFIKFTPNRFEYHMNGGFGDDLAYADSNLPQEQWVHNSIVKDGASLTYYRNGEERNSTTITAGQNSGETLPFGLGADPLTGANAWRGSLDDVQLYTSALNLDQISTVISGEVAGGADLYAHYPLDEGGDSDVVNGTGPGAVEDGAFIDNIDAGLGVDGNVWVEDPDRGTVLTFAGTFVDAGELPLMDLENDFSWNFWSKSDSGQAQTDTSVIMGNSTDFANAGEFIRFTNNRIEFRADGTADSDLEWGPAGPDDNRIPNDDNWYHHTVVKDGDQMKYYRDGVLRNEVSLGLGQQSPDPMPFAIGGQAAPDNPAGEPTLAYYSDVRLYNNALTPAEVAELAGVVIVPEFLEADFNQDGIVNFTDFLVLSTQFNQTVDPPGTPPDINGDGTVNFPDFLVLSTQFNMTSGGAAAVPEPSTMALMGMSVLCLGVLRRRRNA